MISVNHWIVVSLLTIGSVKCLISLDLAYLANRLPHPQCRALIAIILNKPIHQVNSGCFVHLIEIRKDFKVKYGKDGDSFFLGNLTHYLDAIGLAGSSVKLLGRDLNENLIALNQNSFRKVYDDWVKSEEEAETNVFPENPYKEVQRHQEQAKLSSKTALNIVIFVCLIAMAVILTFITFNVIFNLDAPAGSTELREAVLNM